MTKAKLDKNNIATIPGDITVYNYDAETREYLSSSEEYLARGVGIPANSCIDAPPAPREGLAVCRMTDGTGWEHLPDHRGETVYNTETGEPQEISVPGDYPDNTTSTAPTTPYDVWDGEQWVTDKDAEQKDNIAQAESKKSSLIIEASNYINNQQWPSKLTLGRLSDYEKNDFNKWLDYLDTLNDIDTSSAPDIEWPTQPEMSAS